MAVTSVGLTRALMCIMHVLLVTSGVQGQGLPAKEPVLSPSISAPASGVGARTLGGFWGCVFSANKFFPKWCSQGLVGSGWFFANRGWTNVATVTESSAEYSQAIAICPIVLGIQLTAQAGGCECTNGGSAFLQASKPVYYNGTSTTQNSPTGDCRTSGVNSNCNAWYCACYNIPSNPPNPATYSIRIQANCLKLI